MKPEFANTMGLLYDMPEGPEKVAGYEELIRQADADGDDQASYYGRFELIDACNNAGFAHKEITAFSWCLAYHDRHPDEVDYDDLLWRYKWSIAALPSFTTVSRQDIQGLLDDFEKRIVANGQTARTAIYLKSKMQMAMMDIDDAAELMKQYLKMPRTAVSDCLACEKNHEVCMAYHQDDFDAVLEKARPMLRGQLKCRTIPHATYGSVVPALIHLGQIDKATEAFDTGYKLVSKERSEVDTLAKMLCLPIRTKDYHKALKIVERHLPWVEGSVSESDQMWFFNSTGLMFEGYAADVEKSVRIRVPDSLACHEASDTYDATKLADWFRSQAAERATGFDQRNGNTAITEELRKYQTLAGR